MNGATVTIDSAEPTTVYMVDYTPTIGEEKVKNDKWVSESELQLNKNRILIDLTGRDFNKKMIFL